MNIKTSKKSRQTCAACGGSSLKARMTTWATKVGPKQLNIGRVSVRECLDCGEMTPTKAGQEKINRLVMSFSMLSGIF